MSTDSFVCASYGDDGKTGIIVKRFCYVDELWAWHNGVSGLAVPLLNFIIHNWISGRKRKLRPYDEDDLKNNNKYVMSMYSLARAWKVNRTSLVEAKKRLLKLKINGRKVVDQKTVGTFDYLGIDIALIPDMIGDNKARFVSQCVYWGRRDLLKNPIFEGLEEQVLVNGAGFEAKQKEEPSNHSEWAEGIVREICELADKEEVVLYRNGKDCNVFPHLKNGKFQEKRRRGVDAACRLVDDLYSGQFWEDNQDHRLFGTISKEHLAFKNTDRAIERLKFLEGNKVGIRKFLIKCAKNYFVATKPGQETYAGLKGQFPLTVRDFLLCVDRYGNRTANFLMYYSSTLRAVDKAMDVAKTNVEKTVPKGVFNELLNYETWLLEPHICSFWMNVHKLSKKLTEIKNSNKTSYSMRSCYDMVFDKVDSVADRYNKVLPGYFSPEKATMTNALNEIMDR